jgi:uncharacterized protein YeaC (DUF1315 family)
MTIVVIILMYNVSFEFQLPSCVNIHNHCLNTKLVSPVYFCNGAVCPGLSSQQIDIDTKMNANFEINTTQDEFKGALLFKLQRCIESDDQRNMDALHTETDKDETKCVQMLVAWEMKDSVPSAHVTLVEHAKEFTWNEGELRKLYDKNHDRLKRYGNTMLDTWLINDHMILKTSFGVRELKENFELSIFISEEEGNIYAMRPFCVNLER